MGKKVRIASFGLNFTHLRGKTQEEMLTIVMDRLDAVRGYHPDLICLPEIFLKTGGDVDNPRWRELTAEAVEKLQQYAAQEKCYIAATVYEPIAEYPDYKYNTTILIDRTGTAVGQYRKVHTVLEETTEIGVLPGSEILVFDTDFGRIGIQTCFDIGWRDGWKQLADKGAKMIIWSAAYDGGNLLNTYAAYHMVYVVSTVRSDHARIIDPTGRTIVQGALWNGLALGEIDLETTLFHIDRQFQKIDDIRRCLGEKVSIQVYSEENVFTIESNDPQWPMARICQEFGLMTYDEYHAEATAFQHEMRQKYPEKKDGSLCLQSMKR